MAATIEPNACPKCGKQPRMRTTYLWTVYVACLGHLETKGCVTEKEAITLWNADLYEEQRSPKAKRGPSCPLLVSVLRRRAYRRD